MVMRAPARPAPAPRWHGGWLPAADLPLDEERAATISFDRRGRCRLTLALDRPATDADVAALEDAADVLPNLHLYDLDDTPTTPSATPRRSGSPSRWSPTPSTTPPRSSCWPRRAAARSPAPGPVRPARPGPRARWCRRVRGAAGSRGCGQLGLSTSPSATLPDRGPGTAGTPWVEHVRLERTWAERLEPARVERGLLDLGRRLVAATRISASALCALALGLSVAVFVAAFVAATWTAHARFGTYGFDLGIYDQATWLLSRGRAPFVTVRGLDLLGQQAAYIMVLVAPLYRLWADPRLLLLLQVLFLALPAPILYRLATRRLGHPAAGLAVAVAYLAYPGVQWAISWQFHPEAIAAGLLALAVAAADRRRHRAMALWLALAALCGEELGLVVAGFGLLLVVGGRRAVGWRTAGAGLAWFLVATYLLVPLHAGRATRLFETDYGIAGSGPQALLAALPTMAGHALQTGLANDGLFYLLLVFLPLLGLPLLAPRWLLPVAPPLLLNLAAVQPEHHQLRFHYLATAAPLLAAGRWPGWPGSARPAGRCSRPCWCCWCWWPASPAGATGRRRGPATRWPSRPGRPTRPAGRRWTWSTRGRRSAPSTTWSPTWATGWRCTSSPTRSGRSTGAWPATSTPRRRWSGSGSWSSSATCWASRTRSCSTSCRATRPGGRPWTATAWSCWSARRPCRDRRAGRRPGGRWVDALDRAPLP